MSLIVIPIVGIATTLLAIFLVSRVTRREERIRLWSMVGSMAVLAVIAFAGIPFDPAMGDDFGNGIALFLGFITTFFFWVVVVITIVFAQPLIERVSR